MDLADELLKKSSYYDERLKGHKEFMDSVMKKYSIRNSSSVYNPRIENSKEKYLNKNDSDLFTKRPKYESRVDEIVQKTLKKIEKNDFSKIENSITSGAFQKEDRDVEKIIQKIKASQMARDITERSKPRIEKVETGIQAITYNDNNNHFETYSNLFEDKKTEKNKTSPQKNQINSTQELEIGLRSNSLKRFREFYNVKIKSVQTKIPLLKERLKSKFRKQQSREHESNEIDFDFAQDTDLSNTNIPVNVKLEEPAHKSEQSLIKEVFFQGDDNGEAELSEIDFEYSLIDHPGLSEPAIINQRKTGEMITSDSKDINQRKDITEVVKTQENRINGSMDIKFSRKADIISKLKHIEDQIF
jgi:hypothetical protein